MKNASIILSSLALIGVIVLFVMQAGNKKADKHGVLTSNAGVVATSGKVAYVDIDTLNAKFTYLKNKQEDFKKRQEAMAADIDKAEQQLNNDAMAFQQKAQSGGFTQAEGEAAQKRLLQAQRSLETRKQSLTEQLLKETEAFNDVIQQQLDSFLEEYNKEKGFDYILSYKKGNQIMYADKRLDITADVVKGMNERSMQNVDTTKKK